MVEKIEIGDTVKDTITGFKGIVMAEIQYMYGCKQYQVTPKCDENGARLKSDWIDEPQLKLIKKGKKAKTPPRHGGIREHP